MERGTSIGLDFAPMNIVFRDRMQEAISMTYPLSIHGRGPVDSRQKISIGDWSICLHSGQMSRGSDMRALSDQSRKLLTILSESLDGSVSRRVLEDALWPAGGIGEEALNNAVARLRRSLGDTHASPVFIRTLPRRGYQLIAKQTAPKRRPAFPRALAPPVIRGFAWAMGAFIAFGLVWHFSGIEFVEVHVGDYAGEDLDEYVRRADAAKLETLQ